jgi:hypothetical protein
MFKHLCKTATGYTVTLSLSHPPILLKKHLRNNKYELLVDEVQLIDSNAQYAHIRYPDGRDTTVFLGHLAPKSFSPINHQINHIEPTENGFN